MICYPLTTFIPPCSSTSKTFTSRNKCHQYGHSIRPRFPVSWDAQLSLCIRPWWCHPANSSCKIATHSCHHLPTLHIPGVRPCVALALCHYPFIIRNIVKSMFPGWVSYRDCHLQIKVRLKIFLHALADHFLKSLTHLWVFTVHVHSLFPRPFIFYGNVPLPDIPYISEMLRRFLRTAQSRNSR